MARPQEKSVFNQERVDDYNEEASAAGCGCFRRFCFGWGGDEAESHNYLLREREGGFQKESWPVAKVKELKEWSELVAGPKWKNFIRRFGKLCNPRKGNRQTTQLQYSPESYVLNFAGDQDEEENGDLLHSFSSRFAPGYFINDQQRKAAAS